jgi:hypothetical protein
MDGISVLDPAAWSLTELKNNDKYLIGNALGWLSRSEKHASVNSLLSGRLYLAKSGWLLLSVPNAFVRGVFDALTAPGAELPTAGLMNVPNVDADVLNAHISVMTAEEVNSVGADKINERGHLFHYGLGGVKEIPVKNVEGVSKVWVVQVQSPALSALRKSYGLSPLLNGDHPFHITVAARRKHVLNNNGVCKFDNAPSRGELKAAAVVEDKITYDCGCSGQCTCPPTCVCKVSGYCPTKKTAADTLHGGDADNMPDNAFPKKELTEGVKHEREHTDNDQVAKKIAKDHLQERTDYYKKTKEIETASKTAQDSSPIIKQLREAKQHSDSKRYGHKTEILQKLMEQSPHDWRVDDDSQKYHGVTHGPTNFRFHVHPTAIADRVKKPAQKAAYYTPNHPYKSVYVQEALNQFNRRIPITYDHNLPLFKNIQNQLAEIKQRGDFILRTRQNAEQYRAHLDPMYRQQIALDALHNRGPQVPMLDRMINLHGNGILASLGGAK